MSQNPLVKIQIHSVESPRGPWSPAIYSYLRHSCTGLTSLCSGHGQVEAANVRLSRFLPVRLRPVLPAGYLMCTLKGTVWTPGALR